MDRAEIGNWLASLLGDEDAARDRVLARIDAPAKSPDSIVFLLVRAAQDAILESDLPASTPSSPPMPPEERARYFESKYRVGDEIVAGGIPSRRLIKTAAHAGLVAPDDAVFAPLSRRSGTASRVLEPLCPRPRGGPLDRIWFGTASRLRPHRIAASMAGVLLLFIAFRWPAVLRPPAADGADPSTSSVILSWSPRSSGSAAS